MFERYTERARRVIFFARYEASQYGNTAIETEHLVIALAREDKHIVQRFSPNADLDIRKKVEAHISPTGKKTPTSIDLPLSDSCRRILAYANEEAERLSHHRIGTEHLLLGILREKDCVAERVLRELGLELEAVRLELFKNKGAGEVYEELPPADRPFVHALVDQLPEGMLARARRLLGQLLFHHG